MNLVGNGVAALHREPGAGAQLVADPTLAEAAVEDLELEGRRLWRGEVVLLLLAAANRGPYGSLPVSAGRVPARTG